jgi:hypothetical protein
MYLTSRKRGSLGYLVELVTKQSALTFQKVSRSVKKKVQRLVMNCDWATSYE